MKFTNIQDFSTVDTCSTVKVCPIKKNTNQTLSINKKSQYCAHIQIHSLTTLFMLLNINYQCDIER